MRKYPLKSGIIFLSLLVILLLGVSLFLFASLEKPNRPKDDQRERPLHAIALAIFHFHERTGHMPGKDGGKLYDALLDKVPDNIAPVIKEHHVDEEGRFTDSWGTRVEIELTTQSISIRSAGPNRTWGDEDDVGINYELYGRYGLYGREFDPKIDSIQ
jgi:hypothetical protein